MQAATRKWVLGSALALGLSTAARARELEGFVSYWKVAR